MMMNKNLNLLLKLNKSLSIQDSGPFTPLDQTLKTPVDPPNANYFSQNFNAPVQQNIPPPNQIYSHPSYSESDDILTDSDEPSKTTKNYSLNFTTNFDNLVMSIYGHILSLPTTTPFTGTIPPSGLVSKVANETMNNLINTTYNNAYPLYDQHQIINRDMLTNNSFQPIFLLLIRKRLIELCSNKQNLAKLPISTSITVNSLSQAVNSYNQINNPYGQNANNFRQSSISNLSLTELNINNYHEQQAQQQQQKSRAPSVNLRKQSLTRNNSYSNNTNNNGNNWLHVGNLNTISNPNGSTDSLQSMQDFVPQPFINRSASYHSPNQPGNTATPTGQSFGFNNMMMDYQTPPTSNKSSFSTPPSSGNNVQIIQNPLPNQPTINTQEYDEFNFGQRSRSSSNSSRLNSFPRPLTINTDNANIQSMNGFNGNDTLDSPFMSATTPSDEFSLMQNSFGGSIPQSPIAEEIEERSLPSRICLSEKKRDSLKLKRGIH